MKLDFSIIPTVRDDKQHVLWYFGQLPMASAEFQDGYINIMLTGKTDIELRSYDRGKEFRIKEDGQFERHLKELDKIIANDMELQQIFDDIHPIYYFHINSLKVWDAYYVNKDGQEVHVGELKSPYLNEAIKELQDNVDHIPDIISITTEVNDYETIPFCVVVPEDELQEMTEEEKLKLTREYKADYIVVKRKGHQRFYRYFKEEYLPRLGEKVERTGNHYTSMGEGTYCYLLDDLDEVTPMEGRVIGILTGNVEYYIVAYDSGGDSKEETQEVVIKPGQELILTDIIR